tara:strand:- start:292 stop:459 length:168 start_codon:yes stop_codon:yes gene_type:complete
MTEYFLVRLKGGVVIDHAPYPMTKPEAENQQYLALSKNDEHDYKVVHFLDMNEVK